jgi:hypothetical protein
MSNAGIQKRCQIVKKFLYVRPPLKIQDSFSRFFEWIVVVLAFIFEHGKIKPKNLKRCHIKV